MKRMNLILSLALFALFANAQGVFAQEKSDGGFCVHYAVKFCQYENQKTLQEDEMVLEVKGSESRFYSLWSVMRESIKDSVLAIGGDLNDVMAALEKSPYPRARQHYQVWKNVPARNKLTFKDRSLTIYQYVEDIVKPEWTLCGGDSIICGYSCQRATTTFHGRTWTAWFSQDIPVADGPWKLCNLPGLILEAKDADNLFEFRCIELSNASHIKASSTAKNVTECTKKEYYRLMRLKWKDPLAFQTFITGSHGAAFDQKGNKMTYPERKAVFLEKEFEEE